MLLKVLSRFILIFFITVASFCNATVNFSFNWPENLQGELVIKHTIKKRANQQKMTTKTSSRADFAIESKKGDFNIRFFNRMLTKKKFKPRKTYLSLIKEIEIIPNIRVSNSGKLDSFIDFADKKAKMLKGLEEKESFYGKKKADQLRDIIASEKFEKNLLEETKHYWTYLVEFFLQNNQLKKDKEYTFKKYIEFKGVSKEVPYYIKVRLNKTKKRANKTTAVITFEEYVNDTDLWKAISVQDKKYRYKNTYTVEVEPITLIPNKFGWIKDVVLPGYSVFEVYEQEYIYK